MAVYKWDSDKNERIRQSRGVSFEQVVLQIEQGNVLDIMAHPNQEKYPNQKIMVVTLNDYVHAVPFVKQGDECFFKTVIPSRKLTKKYTSKRHEKNTSG